jgi:hypothetical protein
MKSFYKTLLFLLFIISVSVIIYLIYTYTFGLSYSEQGAKGDAFNGFISPFISIASSILVYIAFREQVKANKLLASNTQLETFNNLLDNIKAQTLDLEYTHYCPGPKANNIIKSEYDYKNGWYSKKFSGTDAMNVFSINLSNLQENNLSMNDKEFLKSIVLIYEDLILLEKYIRNSNLDNATYFYIKLSFYFELNFESSFSFIHKQLNSYKGQFYYSTINKLFLVRNKFNEIRTIEHEIFIAEQEAFSKT